MDKQVQDSIAAGAKLLTGGKRIERAGFFYEPTVLTDIPRDSPAYREEIFGPVASFFRVSDAAEAIKIANDSSFGLGASAWTNDPAEKELFASELEAGMVFINSMVASDPRLPFGGAKRSGLWPRARRGGNSRVCEYQDGVDGVVSSRAAVVIARTVIPSRADGEGPHSRSLRYSQGDYARRPIA